MVREAEETLVALSVAVTFALISANASVTIWIADLEAAFPNKVTNLFNVKRFKLNVSHSPIEVSPSNLFLMS